METVAQGLHANLSKIADVELIRSCGSNKWLPFVLPCFLLQSSWILSMKKIDVIYLQDGLLSPLGLTLRTIFNKFTTITIHGLDITYKNWFYQLLIPKCVSRLDKIVCVSSATKEECIKRAVPKEKITVIPNGIDPDRYYNPNLTRNDLEETIKKEIDVEINLKDKKIYLSVGRLVARKGIHWFIENVMPKIVERNKNIIYLIAGKGPYKNIIKEKIRLNNLKENVYLLGKVSDNLLECLYNTSDIFIMPNIPVKGDMEGFGVVALEAMTCGLPVIASDIEGMRDLVIRGENGELVQLNNIYGFIEKIDNLSSSNKKISGTNIRKFILNSYSWVKISKEYLEGMMR